MFEVNIKQLIQALIADLKANITSMVVSSPGAGKSDCIRQIAKEYGLKVIDLRVSQCEPVDMQGFPGVTPEGRMTFHVPEYFPLEGDPIPKGYNGWLLFLDEFNSGNKQTEAACYKLILDRAVYQHKLHPNCRIVAAGNLTTDKAIVNTMSTATASRLTHYKLYVDHNDWIDWAYKNNIDNRIISFIKFKPEILHKFNPKSTEVTFPSPRTWEFVSKIIEDIKDIDDLTQIRIAGTIGEGAAVEFTGYCKIFRNLPTIEEILHTPTLWRIPIEPSEVYAITTMLASNTTPQNISTIFKSIDRLPIEFQLITLKDIHKKNPALAEYPEIKVWQINNASKVY
ncbi:MAG: ATP-binding protein [Nanoarchaeota archaeon]|nr:ATP-binding protein [Nanoarchaeota archaeon]